MTVMPYGVEFASSVFQSRLFDLFFQLLYIVLILYIDNLIVYTKTIAEHLEALKTIFNLCRSANLHLRLEKCTFLTTELKTLGFIISHNLIKPDPLKIKALVDFPSPSNITQLRSFLSLLQYFKAVLPHLSHACHKLYESTSTLKKFEWKTELQSSFETAKDMLCKSLIRNSFDSSIPSVVYTDASLQLCGLRSTYSK